MSLFSCIFQPLIYHMTNIWHSAFDFAKKTAENELFHTTAQTIFEIFQIGYRDVKGFIILLPIYSNYFIWRWNLVDLLGWNFVNSLKHDLWNKIPRTTLEMRILCCDCMSITHISKDIKYIHIQYLIHVQNGIIHTLVCNHSNCRTKDTATSLHQQKTFQSGRKGSVRLDAHHQSRQRYPGGG